ncbi:hypothetical protein I79_002524 [Cricetulus griseus]|uniref:Uncharacterized protein n=1 Tax=Cricetulus griseus TaxID=10029 RepID=G3GXN2_CRIGR|nr:hypothetical protein I79_002524 [Cricetulus griseus]
MARARALGWGSFGVPRFLRTGLGPIVRGVGLCISNRTLNMTPLSVPVMCHLKPQVFPVSQAV